MHFQRRRCTSQPSTECLYVAIGRRSFSWASLALVAVLFIISFVILAGCGTATETPTATSPPSTSSPRSPLETSTPTQEAQPMIVTLGLWLPEELSPYGEGPGADILAQQLTDFSKSYPDLQVEVTVKKAQGRGGLLDFLRTARDAAPSVLPDLVVLDAAELETVAKAGLIHPLDPLLTSADTTDRFPFSAELGTVDEQVLGFVIGADMQQQVHRGVLLDSPPISWTQIISPPVSFLFAAGGRDRQVNDATLAQYLALGGTLTDAEGNPTLDQEALGSVLSFYDDCVETGAISPTQVLDIADPDQAWEQFQAGAGEVAIVRTRQYWLQSDEMVVAASIPTQDGRIFSIARGWAIAIVTSDPIRQELAMLLLDWLIAPDHNAQWTEATGYLPGTRSALRMWDIPEADRATLRAIMESAVAAPQPEVVKAVGPAMQEAVEAVLRGRSTPQKAASDAVQSLEE